VLALLGEVCGAGKVELHLTAHVARTELCKLQDRVTQLEAAGLQVHRLSLKAAEGRRLLSYRSQRNKGERETVAWLAENRAVSYVTCDVGARRFALENGVAAVIDLGELICVLCEAGISVDRIRPCLTSWYDLHAGNGRPKDWGGLDQALLKYRAARR
jgi:hypothetical protein